MDTAVDSARPARPPAGPRASVVDPAEDLLAAFCAEDCPPDAELDAITRVAAALTGAPFAMIQISMTGWMHLIATHGFDRGVVPRTDSLCDRARQLTDGVYSSPDLAAEPEFARFADASLELLDEPFARMAEPRPAPAMMIAAAASAPVYAVANPRPAPVTPRLGVNVATLGE